MSTYPSDKANVGMNGAAGPPTNRGDRRKTIALLVDTVEHFNGGYEGQIRAAIDLACCKLDLNLLTVVGRALGDPNPRAAAHNAIYELLQRDCVDGIILLSGSLANFC